MSTTIWAQSGSRQLQRLAIAKAAGAYVNFFIAGTTTPKTVYTDATATTPADVAARTTDGNGLWPAIFVPYGSYDFSAYEAGGTLLFSAAAVPNPAPFDESVATAPTSLLQPGFTIWIPAAATYDGFVRPNGKSIGSGASSATERANDDTEALFTYLWNNLANDQAAVSGGRGGSAAADFAANKTIALPDLRSSFPIGLDDMGNSAASRFGSATFTHGDATTAGSVVGANSLEIGITNLPAHAHAAGSIVTSLNNAHSHTYSGTVDANGSHSHAVTDPTHAHSIPSAGNILIQAGATGVTGTGGPGQMPSSNTYSFINPSAAVSAAATGISIVTAGSHQHSYSGTTSSVADHQHSTSGETGSIGSGTAINLISRAVLGSWLMKL